MRLKDKVCVITGGSSGLGRAIAETFMDEGARVAVTYNTNPPTDKDHTSHHMDVRSMDSVLGAVVAIAKVHGHFDVWVNNAGVNYTNDFDDQTQHEWDSIIDVNLTGVFRCCQAILPFMRNGGSIINIGSLSGEYGGPRSPAYCASKAGLVGLTHNLARFLGGRNIRVNTLSPGVIESNFTDKTMSSGVAQTVHSLLLLKRFGTYEDMVGGAVFLASDESSYMTGQTLSINGGAWV